MTVFHWGDYLTLAKRLAGLPGGEADLRTAISRAYYAAYHAASAFVRVQGILSTPHTHRAVWDILSSDPDATRADIGLRGDWLKRSRLVADYRTPYPGDIGKHVREAIAEASAVIEALERLSRS